MTLIHTIPPAILLASAIAALFAAPIEAWWIGLRTRLGIRKDLPHWLLLTIRCIGLVLMLWCLEKMGLRPGEGQLIPNKTYCACPTCKGARIISTVTGQPPTTK